MKLKKEKASRFRFKDFLNNAIWAYKEIFSLAPTDTILIVIIFFLSGILPTINSYLYAKAVDSLLKIVITKDTSLIFSTNSPFIYYTLGGTLLTIFQDLLSRLQKYLKYKFSIEHYLKQETKLYTKIANLDMERIENPKYSDDIKRAKENLPKIRQFMDYSLNFFSDLTSFVFVAIIIVNQSWFIALTTLLSTFPSGIADYLYTKKFFNFWNGNLENHRKKRFYLENIIIESNIPQNKIYQSITFFMKKFQNISRLLNTKDLNLRRNLYRDKGTFSILYYLNELYVTINFAFKLVLGQITFGQYNFILSRVSTFSDKLEALFGDISGMIDTNLYINSIKDLLGLKNSITNGTKKIPTIIESIEFKNVSFKYSGNEDFAIKNLNLTIKKNEEIAIVGENGAGKSTLIRLLLRLYDITEGEILINGINIKNFDLSTYYKKIGILFQEFTLYGVLSVKENIVLNSTKTINNAKLKKAVDLAEADSFIPKLRFGFDTLLNKSLKKGQVISSGQKQKIALARMFYRNAPILILDEPTASIDPVSEYNIFKRIYKFMTDKTVIIISHRFSTVRNAQKIYVLDKGRIVEQGSHKELMKLNGKYAYAFNKQAEGYTKED